VFQCIVPPEIPKNRTGECQVKNSHPPIHRRLLKNKAKMRHNKRDIEQCTKTKRVGSNHKLIIGFQQSFSNKRIKRPTKR
jgi:hypothetical protein